jgi:predicted DCC family thiol-disulfide oxidoreductase YuxK
MRPNAKSAYSYKLDDSVPDFDETRILLVMDGNCGLCSSAARRIAQWDTGDEIRIAPAQSALGSALLRHYGLEPDDPDTWLTVREGHARGSLDAMIDLFPGLRWWMGPLKVFRLLPDALQDWIYARIARNRYALFGRDDLCALPDPALRQRLVE